MTTFDTVARPPTGLATAALIRDKIINHVVLVVDASPSMHRHVEAVRAQLRTLITDLAEQSKLMDQETRVTIYAFSTEVRVLVFDVDVLRLVDLKVWDRYALIPYQRTALNDAAAIGLDDLATTSTLYGDHGFLVYVITDGKENDSTRYGALDVFQRVRSLPENWTVAALVPDVAARRYAEQNLGIPGDNIAVWDVSSREGFVAAGSVIRNATSGYMHARATGVRGTRTLFSTGVDAVNARTVAEAVTAGDLQPLQPDSYVLIPVDREAPIKTFVTEAGLTFRVGQGYYSFTKREEIQGNKLIAIVEKKSGRVFADPTHDGGTGAGSPKVRAMIGLPEVTTKVNPDANPDYWIFPQSTSVNRKLIPGQRLLYLR